MATVRLPMPHSGQKRVWRERKRFNILAAGRRWRKTTLVMPMCVEAALEGATIVWGAPVADQVATAYEETEKAVRQVARCIRSPHSDVEIRGAGRILFRSLDNPHNVRSKTADGIVIDECGDIDEAAFSEVMLPMLMDTRGWAWLMGTPKGRNWFWREWVTARGKIDHAAWQIPTLGVEITPGGLVRSPHPYENPEIAFEEIASQFSKMPEMRFRQEILAEFVEDAGGVFRGVMACATGRLMAPYSGSFVLGVDWGKSRDFTVLVLIDVKTRQVVAFDRFNQIDWFLQRRRLWELYRPWWQAGAKVSIVVESNSIGDVQLEELRRGDRAEGTPPLPVQAFLTTQASKQQAIEDLVMAIETQKITYPNLAVLVNELQGFEQTRLPSGLMRYSAPDGMHDDAVMALAIAWQGAKSTPGEFYVPRATRRDVLEFA